MEDGSSANQQYDLNHKENSKCNTDQIKKDGHLETSYSQED
jgi:hypothetical protein